AEVAALAVVLADRDVRAPCGNAVHLQERVEAVGKLGLEPAAGVGAGAAQERGALERLRRQEVAVDFGEEGGGGVRHGCSCTNAPCSDRKYRQVNTPLSNSGSSDPRIIICCRVCEKSPRDSADRSIAEHKSRSRFCLGSP